MPRFAVVLTASLVLVLTGCVEAAEQPELPTSSATPTASPTATPTPTPGPVAGPEPLAIRCADLVDPDVIYAFDPNYALLDDWTPVAGSAGAEAVAADGVACHWVRESGMGTIDVSAARLGDAATLAKKNEAFTESEMVPTYGDEAYFEVANGVGTAIVFQGPNWLVVSSDAFAEPGEATEIVEAALAALAGI